MGAGSSSISELKDNEYLLKFVSKESISPNDPFWNRLLSFSFSPPRTSSDARLLEESSMTLYEALLSNNLVSGNVASLTKVFLTRCAELKESANCENNVFAWQTYNALFILRSLMKFFVENITEENLVRQINYRTADNTLGEDGSVLGEFLHAIIELIVEVPVVDFTYVIHLEAINSLLVLLSEQMYFHKPAMNSIIFQTMMQGKCSIHSCSLMKTLLQHYIKQEKCPPGLSTNASGGSIVLGLAAGLWNVLTLGYGTQQAKDEEHHEDDALLATQSSLLILVLANHCTNDKGIHNPYRQALFSFINSSDSSNSTPTQAVATFKLDYAQLYMTICRTLRDDETTLLLYLLLHRNLNFRSFLISRTDIELLILPILKVLYHAEDKNSHHIYMSLIVLLILSEDEIFNKSIHYVNLKNVSWYTERSMSEISLGGLLILVVIRTIQFNMTRMRDKYLHTNCLAALANMSSQFRLLHAYVTQRLVSLFENLSKKHARILEQIKYSGDLSAKTEDGGEEPLSDVMQDLSVLEEVLRMVLEIINSCLSAQLSQNPNLVYTLLYKKHIFESFRMHPTFQDILLNIDTVLSYFTAKLEASEVELSVNEVLEIIKQGAHQWSHDRLKKFPELKFKYVEEEQPEEFFIPYVWSLVCHSSNLYWNSHYIRLFNAQQS